MARAQYPSDEARKKTRPHVKIHLSTRSHRKTAGHFDKPEFRGQFLALMMLAVDGYAAKNGGELHLSRTHVAWISGRSRPDVARMSVLSLLDVMEYSHEVRGEVVVTWIPKFAKKQGMDSAAGGVTPRTPPPPDTEYRKQSTETENPPLSPPASGGVTGGDEFRIDDFPDEVFALDMADPYDQKYDWKTYEENDPRTWPNSQKRFSMQERERKVKQARRSRTGGRQAS